MNTLIIGGNGYIGSYLYPKLDADSIDLCLFGKDLGYSKKINYNETDISDYKNIILLAGHSSIQMCESSKNNAWINNVDYFYNICQKLSPKQLLIYASSSSVYGVTNIIADETNINLNPINVYDLTKVTIDIIANKFILEGKNIIGLRFGTVNGKSVNTRSDLMINSMLLNYKNNNTIKIKNEWVKRPLLGIEDLTNGILSILNSNVVVSGQYNMSSFNTEVKEVANKIKKKTGCQIIKIKDDDKYYDFQISSKKFEDIFNFKFKDTLDTIIDSLLESDFVDFSSRPTDNLLNLKNHDRNN
jgi:nucleoside-diphosphate-sugar epimerase